MKRLLSAFCLMLLSSSAFSQSMTMGVDKADSSGYTGPGNVVSGAKAWWGLRAYSAAYAAGLNKIANICISTGTTGPDTTCGDVNSDSSGNFNIAGSTVSACSNSGANQCTVKTLYDQSGASSCTGPCDVTQATVANRPILVVPGAANGCPTTAKFCMSTTVAGAQNLSATTNLSATIPQAFTISIVFNNPVRTTDEYMFDTTGTIPRMISGFSGANLFTIYIGVSTPTATASDGSYHALQGVFNNASSDINVDGSVNTVGIGASSALPANNFVLFNNSSLAASFGGFSQEYGVWPVGFTPTNSSNMSANQHAYWGF